MKIRILLLLPVVLYGSHLWADTARISCSGPYTFGDVLLQETVSGTLASQTQLINVTDTNTGPDGKSYTNRYAEIDGVADPCTDRGRRHRCVPDVTRFYFHRANTSWFLAVTSVSLQRLLAATSLELAQSVANGTHDFDFTAQ